MGATAASPCGSRNDSDSQEGPRFLAEVTADVEAIICQNVSDRSITVRVTLETWQVAVHGDGGGRRSKLQYHQSLLACESDLVVDFKNWAAAEDSRLRQGIEYLIEISPHGSQEEWHPERWRVMYPADGGPASLLLVQQLRKRGASAPVFESRRPSGRLSFFRGAIIDTVFNSLHAAAGPANFVFFRQGFGDMHAVSSMVTLWQQSWQDDGLEKWLAASTHMPVEWRAGVKRYYCSEPWIFSWTASLPPISGPMGVDEQEVSIDEAVMDSPLAKYLPEGAIQQMRFLFVRRAPSSRRYPPTRCIMLHMAAIADEDYESRLSGVALPLLEHGIASAILMPPFYGLRRAKSQTRYFVNTVAEYLLQNFATASEGAFLLRWLSDGFRISDTQEVYHIPVGVCGFSWGAAMAGIAAVISRRPVACIPYIGSETSSILSSGLLQWQVDWEALGHDQERLQHSLRDLDVASIASLAPKPKATMGALAQVLASHDEYTSAEEGLGLYTTLSSCVMPGGLCELEWVSGGHVTAYLQKTANCLPVLLRAANAVCATGDAPP